MDNENKPKGADGENKPRQKRHGRPFHHGKKPHKNQNRNNEGNEQGGIKTRSADDAFSFMADAPAPKKDAPKNEGEAPRANDNRQKNEGANGGGGRNNRNNRNRRNRHRSDRRPERQNKEEKPVQIEENDLSPVENELGYTNYSLTIGSDYDPDPTEYDDIEPAELPEPVTYEKKPPEHPVDVVGIRFRGAGKVYYFAPGEVKLRNGDHAVVETARGLEYGYVVVGNTQVDESEIVPPLRPVIRAATKEDDDRHAENTKKEEEAFTICVKKIADHKLEMKLVDVEYTFDCSKLLFYFTSDGRVDFRELVKDLASVFRTRIELRQIGIRDEAKTIGGLGVCGRPFCCHTFLSDFVQVSIKMAKEQNLSLNSTKISGTCGRLMCCLRYEHEAYQAEIKLMPAVDSTVKTEDGVGVVTEINPIAGLVKVKINDKDAPPKFHDKKQVTVIKPAKHRDQSVEEPDQSK